MTKARDRSETFRLVSCWLVVMSYSEREGRDTFTFSPSAH